MESKNTGGKYEMLRKLLEDGKDLDEIMTHIESTGITSEESRANLETGQSFSSLPLVMAVVYERTDVIHSLIQKGFDPHARYVKKIHLGEHVDEICCYLIHTACRSDCNIDVIKYLVDEHHVDVKVVDRDSSTSVTCVLSSTRDKETMLEIVKYLVEKGVDVRDTVDLPYARLLESDAISKYLILCGGMLCAKPPHYYSPLMCAAKWGNLPLVKLLVEAGASVDGSEGRKLFLIAVARNNLEMVEYCDFLNIDLDWDRELFPAIHIAMETGAYKVARYLVVEFNVSLERTRPDGQTAFDMAFTGKDIDFVELFIETGYNPGKEPCLSEDHEDEDLQELAHTVQESVAKRTLQDHCVFQVRRSLGRRANEKVRQLPLPTKLKKLVQLDHIPEIDSTTFFTYSREARVKVILSEDDSVYENNGIDPVGEDGASQAETD